MSDISTWSDDAAVDPAAPNNSVPNYMPEGSTPIASVNDWSREAQAAIRRFYENVDWRDYGFTAEKGVGDTIDVPTGKGVLFNVGQRVQYAGIGATITAINSDALTLAMDGGGSPPAGPATLLAGLGESATPAIDVSSVKDAMALASATAGNVAVFDSNGQVANGPDIDAAPANGSSGLVESGGVFDAIQTAVSVFNVTTIESALQGHIVYELDATTGLMIHWGVDATSTGNGVVDFAPDFSATPYAILTGCYNDGTGSITATPSLYNRNRFGFSYNGAGDMNDLAWCAIGPVTLADVP